MARMEFRPQGVEARDVSPGERYEKELTAHVTAIQKRFDRKIAESIGFDGEILAAFTESLVPAAKNELSIDRRKMPQPLRRFIKLDKLYYTPQGGLLRPSAMFRDKNATMDYQINCESSPERMEIIMEKRDGVHVNFTKKGEHVTDIGIVINDYYNFDKRSFPTRRTVSLYDTSNPMGMMAIGQEKNHIQITSLLYGNIDRDGNLFMLENQGVYTNNGRPESIDWNEDANRLTVRTENEIFYFPLVVNPHYELIDVANRLGV